MRKVTAYRTDYGELFGNENDAVIAERNHKYKVKAEDIVATYFAENGINPCGRMQLVFDFLTENKLQIMELGALV